MDKTEPQLIRVNITTNETIKGPDSNKIAAGEEIKIRAMNMDSVLYWALSNENVCQIREENETSVIITGLKEGRCVITAYTHGTHCIYIIDISRSKAQKELENYSLNASPSELNQDINIDDFHIYGQASNQKEKKHSSEDIAKSIVLLAWFAASIITLIVVGKSNMENKTGWLFLDFGQVFAVFGIIFSHGFETIRYIKEKKFDKIKSRIPLIFIFLLGIVFIIVALAKLLQGEAAKYILSFYSLGAVIGIVGLVILLIEVASIGHNRKISWASVDVECIEIKEHLFSNSRHMYTAYSPIWYGTWAGRKRVWEGDTYSNDRYNIGDVATIQVNSKEPDEFKDGIKKPVNVFMLFFGILLLVIGIGLIIAYSLR